MYVQQQRMNEVQILVISENTFLPRTMIKFADSSENNKKNE